MSRENVEIVRRGLAAWNAGDMDAVRDQYDPDVIVRSIEGWPEPGPFVGREAVLRWFEQLREAWDADALEPISFIDAGDRVVVRLVWRGAGQGPESNMELTNVPTVRKGRIFYQEFFWDHAEALEAVGLRESQENVAVVRRIYDAWATGDFRARVDDLDRHVVLVIGPDFPDSGVFHGTDGVRDWMGRFLEQWERLTIEAKHLQVVGDTVLAHVVQHAKGRASGIEGDLWYCMLFTFRGGKIVRMECIMGESEALDAVGLSEQDAHPDS